MKELRSVGVALLFTLACGDSGDDGRGGAAASSGTSPTTVTSTGASQSQTSSSTGAGAPCVQLCDARVAGGCATGIDCVPDCEKRSPPARCGAEHDAFVACKATADACGASFDCMMEEGAYSACLYSLACGTHCESGIDGSCGCTFDCDDGMELTSDCDATGTTRNCVCSRGGMVVGQCIEPAPMGSTCSFATSCCGEMLAAP